MRKPSLYVSIVVIAIIGLIAFYFLGTPAPKVSLSPAAGEIAAKRELVLRLDAQGAILEKLENQRGRCLLISYCYHSKSVLISVHATPATP
jgi:hypothetical protein